jgi:hypothetical protein
MTRSEQKAVVTWWHETYLDVIGTKDFSVTWMAVLHSTAMAYAGKASLQADPQTAVKMLNLSLRAMETFQRDMLTLKRYRATGEQKIVIERVNIEGGGQAMIGNVHPGGKGEKL